jgi:aminopeptidase 2
MKRTLALALSDDVKSQDIYLPIAGLRSRPEGILALWEWLTTNWEPLSKKLPPSLGMLGTVVQLCIGGFTRTEHIKMIEGFFEEKSTRGFDRTLAQALDAIKARASWVERDGEDVKAWLKENEYLQ